MYTEIKEENISELKTQTASHLSTCLKNANLTGKRTLLLLSGGSNLDYLDQVDTTNLDDKVTIVVLDERFSVDPTKNNLAQIESKANKFYSGLVAKGSKIIDTKIKDGDTRDGLAKRFNNELVNWLDENHEGNIVITAGVGPDGHISGMKPLPKTDFEKLFESGVQNDLVVDYDASSVDAENPERITTTMNFFRRIKNIAKIIVYAVNKNDALQKVKAETGEINETPARILNEMSDVTIFAN